MNQAKFYLLLLSGVIFLTTANAIQPLNSSDSSYSIVAHSPSNQQNMKAKQWGLTDDEWQRYQDLMAGQLGIYSPNIDPLTALGISARNDRERQYYAELQVVAESERINRELAYQHAYDEAFKRIYPGLLPIAFLTPTSLTSTLSSPHTINERLMVFIEDNCIACDTRIKQLNKDNVAFDIYMLATNNDDAIIRRWATRVGIDNKKVFAREITLNHDAGRWQQLGLAGELPIILKEVNGQWQRQ